ncbi:hypothetical protein EJ07DRAFT_181134 [Lizonia empirigonia]|nr:hypothetical protein EJ07DRAFT_181134 [Lizonia empirigonia]
MPSPFVSTVEEPETDMYTRNRNTLAATTSSSGQAFSFVADASHRLAEIVGWKVSADGQQENQDTRAKLFNDDNPRPVKRRKTAEPKERTTERLDLSSLSVGDEEPPQLRRFLSVLHKKHKIVVVAGAGISVSAGIPDFRSATGLFNSVTA